MTNSTDQHVFSGTVTFTQPVTLPAGTVGNNQVSASNPITADKLYHQYTPIFSQDHGTAATAQRSVLHVATGAGSVVSIDAGVSVANVGDSTISVDVYKNGATVLTAPISLSSSQAAFELVAGAIADTTVADEDVYEVVATVTAGTGTLGQGLFVQLVTREAP